MQTDMTLFAPRTGMGRIAGVFALVLTCLSVWGQGDAEKPEPYDSMYTTQALNIARVSIYKIIQSQDKGILDAEYRSILDNLAKGKIAADPAMLDTYNQILGTITELRLQGEDAARLQRLLDKRCKRAIVDSIVGIRAYGGDPWTFLGSLVVSTFTAGFNWQRNKDLYREDFDEQTWQISKMKIGYLDGLQRQFFTGSWELARKYMTPDEFELTDEAIRDFSKAIVYEDTKQAKEKACRLLRRMEGSFGAYPPFWVQYGVIAQDAGDLELATKCYDKYESIRKDVLRKDPFYAEVCRQRILLLGKDKPDEVLKYAGILLKHVRADEWQSFLLAGVAYYSLGKTDEAEDCMQRNIDEGFEPGLHSMLLADMKAKLPLNLKGVPVMFAAGFEADDQFQIYSKGADQGKADAQFHLGWMYDHGTMKTPRDYAKAMEWYLKAAGQNYAPAKAMIGFLYQNGQGVDEDPAKAAALFAEAVPGLTKGAERGDAACQLVLAYLLGDGLGVEEDERRAFELLELAAKTGNGEAIFSLGRAYYNASGTNEDRERGEALWEQAAGRGCTAALYRVGFLCFCGEKRLGNEEKGARYLLRAAEQGDEEAWYSVAEAYADGTGIPTDEAKAQEWYRKAANPLRAKAERGNAEAQFHMGLMLMHGKGVPENRRQAAELLTKAAEQGEDAAFWYLGQIYESGQGIAKDETKAAEFYRLSAEKGWPGGALFLGDMYADGRGVAKDDAKAAEWYLKAAEQSDHNAQRKLGVMYMEGRGVPQDDSKSVEWYRKAADQGDAKARDFLTKKGLSWGGGQ